MVENLEKKTISQQELSTIKASLSGLELIKLRTEKAISDMKVAELEHKALILEIFNKYQINSVTQGISPDGEIIELNKGE
jgi:hypothetical protein